MPIDPYAPCPGGTGKKVKFCCPDLPAELEKIQRMLEGDQRAACLEHIESIESKYPDRACLLSIKTMLAAQLGEESKAEATLARFVEKHPANPVALAEQATLAAAGQDSQRAVGLLQDALEKCGEQIPPQVYDAIGMVAQGLLVSDQIISARAHLVLQLGMAGTQDRRPLELLMGVNGSPSVPLLAKQDMPLLTAPDDALWKPSFAAAMTPGLQGAWRQSAGSLVELAAKVGDWPAIWHNIAVLRAWLADGPGAVEALRKYAAGAIPRDDAVEAEALAQSLDPDGVDTIDVLVLTYELGDLESTQAQLAASGRSLSMPLDLARMGNADEPPPKGAYWLLDRPAATGGATIARRDIPRMVGQVFAFGKQTDRPARLELIVYRNELSASQAALAEIVGASLAAPAAEKVSSQVPALQQALSWNWRLPDDTPADRRRQLIQQEREEVLLARWPDMPQKALGGRSPRQAAADSGQQNKVLAAILVLELALDAAGSEFDFNRLRSGLGLPPAEPIDPRTTPVAGLPLVRLARVEAQHLADEDLIELYRRADHFRFVTALRKFALAIIDRPSLHQQIKLAEVYGVLAQVEPDAQKAIEYLDRARKAAEEAKTSTAPWDLAELSLRIARGEVTEADRLLHHIREQHLREPGVAQALYQILAEAGIIGPDGRPTAAPPAAHEAAGIVVPGAAAAEPGKIWTPGSEQPSGKKSALWTPGD